MNTTTNPTYWLRCTEGGESGPYTKSQARKIIALNSDLPYEARREGEAWQPAGARLKREKSRGFDGMMGLGMLFFLGGVVLTVLMFFSRVDDIGDAASRGVCMTAAIGAMISGAVFIATSRIVDAITSAK